MEALKIVQKNEANNFLSDALVLIQELNKANGKDLTKEEKKELLIRLDEFSTSFIYFRESYDESKSKIHQLAEAMEDIRQISFDGEERFQNAPDDQAGNDILMQMICEIMDKLENMNGSRIIHKPGQFVKKHHTKAIFRLMHPENMKRHNDNRILSDLLNKQIKNQLKRVDESPGLCFFI